MTEYFRNPGNKKRGRNLFEDTRRKSKQISKIIYFLPILFEKDECP